MKKAMMIFMFFFHWVVLYSGSNFNSWFLSGTMRVNFVLAGDAETTRFFLSDILREPYWGGSQINLVDTFHYGDYFFTLHDVETGKLIFSRGFSTLFREWQTIPEAEEIQKAFSNALRFPYPRNPFKLEVFLRRKDQTMKELISLQIDPSDPQIKVLNPGNVKVRSLIDNGPYENSLDLVIIAEGYRKQEMRKFTKDAKRLTEYLFSIDPFSLYRHKFNVRLIYSESPESGTDFPGEGIWRNTVVNSNFYTFGIERYLTSTDFWTISDIASRVPYDQIIILVNSDKYGGGGIFNFYTITSTGHTASAGVLVHELGHSFAGLGDEYYTSDVSYEGFYDLNYEPWEPNLTTLQKFSSKWMDMVPSGVPVPTPVSKEYDGIVGVFEGGGYVAKGIFRPQIDCIMKNNSAPEFCLVCRRAIEKMIIFHTE